MWRYSCAAAARSPALAAARARPSRASMLPGLLAQHAPPLVHRLVVLLGLPEAPGEPEAKRAPGAIEGHRAPILLAMSWWVCFAKMGRKFEKQHTFPLLVLRRDYKAQELPG